MYVHSTEHRAVRLLSRRYDLTNTGYKFLEIGINVGPPSYVEVALGDHRGHELSLSLKTWKSLYEQRGNIYKLFRNEYKDNFISVGPYIDVMFERLARLVDTVDTKYTRFSNIASENIIRDSDIFNGHQLVLPEGYQGKFIPLEHPKTGDRDRRGDEGVRGGGEEVREEGEVRKRVMRIPGRLQHTISATGRRPGATGSNTSMNPCPCDLQYVPLLSVFRNSAMRQIHWDNMSVIAEYDVTPDAGTTLRKIISLNLDLENDELMMDLENLLAVSDFMIGVSDASYAILENSASQSLSNIDNNLLSVLVALDFLKEFDTVNHELLLAKFHFYVLSPTALSFLRIHIHKPLPIGCWYPRKLDASSKQSYSQYGRDVETKCEVSKSRDHRKLSRWALSNENNSFFGYPRSTVYDVVVKYTALEQSNEGFSMPAEEEEESLERTYHEDPHSR
ncbi:hypothetical protein G5I_02099 [Acromyrmex echinatior]|uniref:Uncharacterized protein n=1 Tax=Acromyrmex echinatior TaxID=103372 RepID=F4W9E7_ACREC|nr:hypothetical protein G5I_02099 [Acromyrmex echinatior]